MSYCGQLLNVSRNSRAAMSVVKLYPCSYVREIERERKKGIKEDLRNARRTVKNKFRRYISSSEIPIKLLNFPDDPTKLDNRN